LRGAIAMMHHQRWRIRVAMTGALLAWLTLGLQLYLTTSLVLAQGRSVQHGLFLYFG
jgi:hypothetical protein